MPTEEFNSTPEDGQQKATVPALRRISELDLSGSDSLGAVFKGWCALDPVTGAQLSASGGRTHWGDRKYILILPTQTPEERGGLFADYDWTEKDRKFIRAWSLDEAIEIANKRLKKMLAQRATSTER